MTGVGLRSKVAAKMYDDMAANSDVYRAKYKSLKEAHSQLQQQLYAKEIEITRLLERCNQQQEQNKELQEELNRSREEHRNSVTYNVRKDIELAQLREFRGRRDQDGASSDMELQRNQEIHRLRDLAQNRADQVSQLQALLEEFKQKHEENSSDCQILDLQDKVEQLEQELCTVRRERNNEVEVYKIQAETFESDFNEERRDREKQNDIIFELREAAEKLHAQLQEQNELVPASGTVQRQREGGLSKLVLVGNLVRLALQVAPLFMAAKKI